MSQIVAELAPTGVLRAGINMSNFLLVTGKTASGDPQGVSPDMAAEIARRLGVPVAYVPFERPSKLADAAGTNVWDIGLIGAEPQRAEKITFTAAYCEIEATYLVPKGSPISNIAEVDRPGVRDYGAARRRLRSLAGAEYQAGDCFAVGFGRRSVRSVRHRKTGSLCGFAAAASDRRRKAAWFSKSFRATS